MLKTLILIGILGLLSGCQRITAIEYYDVTEANKDFSTKQSGNSVYGHGPVKRIEGKSGVPDFSDNKSFSLKFSVL